MKASEVEALCRAQCTRYGVARGQDIVKALHQAIFGCGHLVKASEEGLAWLRSEAENLPPMPPQDVTEPLGARFIRLHLQALQTFGLTAETAYRLFLLSAQMPCGTAEEAAAAAEAAKALPFLPDDAAQALTAWQEAGFPACRHSEAFRAAYAPAYRVISADFAPLLKLLGRIDALLAQKERVIVAVEGSSASGKTTLARRLEEIYGCEVFHMDDFFLQNHQRTPERYEEPGGNVDRERFYDEVLRPLTAGQPIAYRRFDCASRAILPAVPRTPGRLNIVEGAYSCHPALSEAYDLKVFLSVTGEEQHRRILQRNGEVWAQQFFSTWIPMEQRYFKAFSIPEQCDLTLHMESM